MNKKKFENKYFVAASIEELQRTGLLLGLL